jgi:hypothetical protein
MDINPEKDVARLVKDLESASAGVRMQAAQTLTHTGDQPAIASLQAAESKETDAQVKKEISAAIKAIGTRSVKALLEQKGRLGSAGLSPSPQIPAGPTLDVSRNATPASSAQSRLFPEKRLNPQIFQESAPNFDELIDSFKQEASIPLDEESITLLRKTYDPAQKQAFETRAGRSALLAEVERIQKAGGLGEYQEKERQAASNWKYFWIAVGLIILVLVVSRQPWASALNFDLLSALPIPKPAGIGLIAGFLFSIAYTLSMAWMLKELNKDPTYQHNNTAWVVPTWLISLAAIFIIMSITAYLRGLSVGASIGVGLRVGLAIATLMTLFGLSRLFWRPTRIQEHRYGRHLDMLEYGAGVNAAGAFILVILSTAVGTLAGWLDIQTISKLFSR